MSLSGLGASGLPLADSAAATTPRSVYVTALDQRGTPVLDLASSDFIVKEDGKVREVVAARLASAPMQISLIVDDNGTGLFRTAIANFVQRLIGEATFSVSVVMGQPMRLVDYTADSARLQPAISYLSARPATPDGGQLLAAIYETARDLHRRESQRPIIVVFTVGGAEHSTMPAHYVLDQLRDSAASLHVFAVANSALRADVAIDRASTLLETMINIQEVIGDGPKLSGGRKEEITGTAGNVRGLQLLAEELSHQYLVSYVLPEGVKRSEKLSVSSTRPGVQVRAPTRIPYK